MSNEARSELFLFIGVAFATAIGLFVLSKWYASYFDVQYHAKLAQGGPFESVVTAREDDQKALASGKMPIEQAIQRLSQGRTGVASIAPAPSEDLSALSGWIRHPAYKPVTAHPVRTPRASKPAPAPTAQAPADAQAPAPVTTPAAPGTASAPETGALPAPLKPAAAPQRKR